MTDLSIESSDLHSDEVEAADFGDGAFGVGAGGGNASDDKRGHGGEEGDVSLMHLRTTM